MTKDVGEDIGGKEPLATVDRNISLCTAFLETSMGIPQKN